MIFLIAQPIETNLDKKFLILVVSKFEKYRYFTNSVAKVRHSGEWASERLTWKSFYGVVGNPEIRLEGLKCINLSSDTISGIPTFFLM